MGYTLTSEERIVLSELQSDLIETQKSLIKSIIGLLNYLLVTTKTFLLSLEEFNLKNIKSQGLGEILYQRALRFFKLEHSQEKRKSSKTVKGKGGRIRIRRGVILLLLIIKRGILLMLNLLSRKKHKKKIAQNVYVDKYS